MAPLFMPLISEMVCCSCSSQLSWERRMGISFSALAVGLTPLLLRISSGKPNSSSMELIMWLMPEVV